MLDIDHLVANAVYLLAIRNQPIEEPSIVSYMTIVATTPNAVNGGMYIIDGVCKIWSGGEWVAITQTTY